MGFRRQRPEQDHRLHRQDREALQKRDQLLNRVPKHITVFAIPIVDDPSFDEPVIQLVSNIRDADPHGKIPGRGCPGGGLEGNEYNHPETGLIREIHEETGLTVSPNGVYNYCECPGKIIYRSLRDPNRVSEDVFFWPKTPRLRSSKRWKIECTNPLFFYVVTPKWIGTPQQQLFRRLRQQLLAGGRSANEIRLNGLFYDFTYPGPDTLGVTHEQLGITAEGKEEIDGLALFPLSRIKYEFEHSEKAKGARGYPYFHHFHTISEYGRCILTWYRWLKEQLIQEAEAQIESAYSLPDAKLPLLDRVSQALTPSNSENANVPQLADALAEYCQALNMRNPIKAMDFRDWLIKHDQAPEACPAERHPGNRNPNKFS